MKLLEPISLGPLRLPNRIVMAPMTRNRAEGTITNALMVEYYRQHASAGLIITEATQVDPHGQGYPNTPGIHSDEHVEGWKQVTEAVHDAGGRIFLQPWHVGRISHSSFHDGALPVAPSAIKPGIPQVLTADGQLVEPETPRALERDELANIASQFVRGARLAREAGFDGVEIHGANGYLLDQFLQSNANQRTDQYGGSVENRARMLLEVTDYLIDEWGPHRVGVRLAPAGGKHDMRDDNPEETFGYVAWQLNERPLAYLHGVEGRIKGTGMTASELLRRHYRGLLMIAGGYDRATGEQALQRGEADLIAYARLFLANPDLPHRFEQGAPLNDWDPETFYGGGEEGYIDYPTLEERAQ